MTATPSIAVVGASENGIPWAYMLLTSLKRYDFAGEFWPVNPNRDSVLGYHSYPTVDDLPSPPDIAFVVLGATRVLSVVERLIELGCPRVVVVSNGFKESGTPEGIAREAALKALAEGTATRVIGPNCVGFASFHEQLCAIGQPVPLGIEPGEISIVSQSGGLTGAVMGSISGIGLGLDVCYSIGNGAAFSLSTAIRDAAARPTTKVVCAVVESVGDPGEFEAAVAEVHGLGKFVAVLLLGQSEGSRGVSASHTGAVVGEYRMMASWFERLRVPLAGAADELGRIAEFLARCGRPKDGTGIQVATVSGGGASLTGDLAVRAKAPMASLTASTRAGLVDLLPEGAYVGNPLDVATGDAPAVYALIAQDPTVGVLVEPWVLPWPDESPDYRWQRDAIRRVAEAGRSNGVPVVVGSLYSQQPSEWAREFARETGIVATSDLQRSLEALARIYGTQDGVRNPDPAPKKAPAAPSRSAGQLVIEAEGREILTGLGLPVIGGAACSTVDEVVAAAARLQGPFALKLSLPGLGHRERVGGIRLGVDGEEQLRKACAEIAASAQALGVPGADNPAFLIEEMVFGPELLVGLIRDPLAGPTMTLAVGGWAAEAGATFGTVLLPFGSGELEEHAERWRLPHLLGAERTAHLLASLAKLADHFTHGGLSAYSTVEINPLMLTRHGARIVDVLLVQ